MGRAQQAEVRRAQQAEVRRAAHLTVASRAVRGGGCGCDPPRIDLLLAGGCRIDG